MRTYIQKYSKLKNNNHIVTGQTSGAFVDVCSHDPSHVNTPPYGVTLPTAEKCDLPDHE